MTSPFHEATRSPLNHQSIPAVRNYLTTHRVSSQCLTLEMISPGQELTSLVYKPPLPTLQKNYPEKLEIIIIEKNSENQKQELSRN